MRIHPVQGQELAVATPRSGQSVLIAFAILFALAAIPLFSVDLPPLVDYPNHLVRMFILHDGGQDPLISRFYEIRWSLLPNLAMDVTVPWLLSFMPLMWAGKLFLLALLAVTAGGMVLLHRALWGRWSLWPCLGFALLYNRIFLWGFVNFLFGLGMALLVAALWVASRRLGFVVRLLLMAVAATVVFFCHIEAQGMLFLLLCGIEAPLLLAEAKGRQGLAIVRRLLALGLPFVPAAAIVLISWQHKAGGGWTLSSPAEKLEQLATVFKNYHTGFDIACSLAFAGLFVGLGMARRLSAAPALVWWLSVTITAFVLMPNTLFGGASADHRIPLLIAMMLVVGTAPRRAGAPGLWRWVAVGFCLILAVRLAAIEQIWLKSRAIYAADIAVLETLPMGALMGVANPWEILHDTDIPPTHLPTLAIPMRHAFVPPLFAYPGQQPVRLREGWHELEQATKPDRIWAAFVEGDTAERTRILPLVTRYDYMLFEFLTPFKVLPDPCLQFVSGTPNFQLYRVVGQSGLCTTH